MIEKTDCDQHQWIPLLGIYKKRSVPTSLFTCLKCGDLKVGTKTIKISAYRLDMGELPINNVAGIQLMNEPSVDTTASGFIMRANIDANTGGVGTPLFMGSNNRFSMANARSVATSPCLALALDKGVGLKRILLHGILRLDSWNWKTGPGAASLIYISTTTGKLTQTQPYDADNVVQPVGWALSDDCIYFAPSMMYLTHV